MGKNKTVLIIEGDEDIVPSHMDALKKMISIKE